MESVVIETGRVEDHEKLLAEKEGEINEIKNIVEAKQKQIRDLYVGVPFFYYYYYFECSLAKIPFQFVFRILQAQHEQKNRKMVENLVNAEHSAAQIKTMEKDMQQLQVIVLCWSEI